MAMTPEQQAAYDQQMAEIKSYAPEPNDNKKKKIVIILAIIVLAIAILLLMISQLTKNDKPASVSLVQNNQITAQDAAPAIAATQEFIGLLAQKNLTEAANRMGEYSGLPNPLNQRIVDDFFGPNLKWAECTHAPLASYNAASYTTDNGVIDYVHLDFNCGYEDNWKAVIRFSMGRNATQNGIWLFDYATVMDAGTTGGTI